MGYGMAVMASGFLMLIVAVLMHPTNGLLGAIGILLIIGGAGLRLIMTVISATSDQIADIVNLSEGLGN
jgi:hypothetical protein